MDSERFPNMHKPERHAATQDSIERMLNDFEITLTNHEPVTSVQRRQAISVLEVAHMDLEGCTFNAISYGAAENQYRRPATIVARNVRLQKHIGLMNWCSKFIIDLIKTESGNADLQTRSEGVTMDRIDMGRILIAELSSCRVNLKME